MATFTYDQIDIAVGKAEQAAETYINVATLQSDFTKGENYGDIKTLKRRIDDYLEDNVIEFSGDDGIDVTAINLDTKKGIVTVDFSDGNQETFTDLKPEKILSIVNYSIDNDDSLVQTYSNESSANLGRVVGEDGNLLTDASIDDDGFITFTFLDGNTYKIANVDNFGENPITDAKIEEGLLYVEVANEWVKASDKPVEGPRGADGTLLVEASEDTVLTSIDPDTENAVLNIPLDDGTTITLTNVPTERRVAEKTDALGLEWNKGQDVVFTLPTGERRSLGRFMGEEAEDGEISPTLKDLKGGRKIVDNLTGIESTDTEYQRSIFKNENFIATATNEFPVLRYITPNVEDVRFGGINTEGNREERLYTLEGVYEDVFSDDVSLDNAYITPEGILALDLSFTDQNDNPMTNTVELGNVVGDDGKSITDIAVKANGNIEVTYNDDNGPDVIGNIAYDNIASAEIDPISNRIKLTLESGLELTTDNTNISGDDGVARSVANTIRESTDDDGNAIAQFLKFEMSLGVSPIDVGVIRPLRNHTVNVTDAGQLAIKLDGEDTETEYGKITGQDAPTDITDTLFDGNSLSLEVNNGNDPEINVTGEVRRYTLADYKPSEEVIRLTNSDTETIDVPYTRPDDGVNGIWITDWNVYEDPNKNGRLLDVDMSDGSKALEGFVLDERWLEKVEFADNDDLVVTFGYSTGNETVTVGNYPEMNGEDGVYPTTIQVEDVNLWARDWNDNRPDQDLGQILSRYIEELYVDDDPTSTVMLRYSNELEATGQLGLNLRGDMARYVTNFSIDDNRDLVVEYNYGDSEVVPRIDGLDARYITDITRDGDTFTLTFSDNSIETVDLLRFDGNLPRWITDFTINADGKFAAKYSYLDYDNNETEDTNFTVIDQGIGRDTEYIVNVKRDGDVFTTVDKDGNETIIGSINSFDGIEGEFLDSISVDADNKLVASWYNDDQPDEVLLDNVDFDIEIFLITINQEGNIVISYSDGTEYVSPVVVYRRMTDAYNELSTDISYIETNYTDSDIEIGNTAGTDYDDGTSIQQIYIDEENNKLLLDLDDNAGTTITAGDFVRREIKDFFLTGATNQNLEIQYNDGTSDIFNNIRGADSSNLNMVDGFINQQYELVLTLNDPNTENDAIVPIKLPGVRGDDGIGIASTRIDNGNLILVLDDEAATEIDAGFINIDFGFSPFDPTKTYQRAQTMTQNGTIYAAQRDGVEVDPTVNASAWTTIRLEGDPTPDAGRPSTITPADGDEIPYVRPFLQGSNLRSHYSPDVLDYREFQIDVTDGNFNNPVYTAQENRTDHQVTIDLDPTQDYKWRIRDVVAFIDYTTNWSFSQTFSIASETVSQPTIDVATGQDVNAMTMDAGFVSSSYTGNDTHVSSTWQVVDDSTGEIVYEIAESANNKTSLVVPWGILKPDTVHRVRVRYHLQDKATSFSDWLSFTTKTVFDSIAIKPEIAFNGDDSSATVAKPDFSVTNIDSFWTDYYDRSGLTALWEVYDDTDSLVWSIETAVDITDVRVGAILDSGKAHKIRVRYIGDNDFIGPSEWSDYFTFTPVWSINLGSFDIDPESDITAMSVSEEFTLSSFTINNDEFIAYEWKLEYFNDGNTIIFDSDISFFESENKITFFASSELSNSDARASVRVIGRYGMSDWSEIDFTYGRIVDEYLFTASDDGYVKKFTREGIEKWEYQNEGQRITSVFSDTQTGATVFGSDDNTVSVLKRDGTVSWKTDTEHNRTVNDVGVTLDGDVVSVSNDNTANFYDIATGELKDTIDRFNRSVTAVGSKYFTRFAQNNGYLFDERGVNIFLDGGSIKKVLNTPYSRTVVLMQDGTVYSVTDYLDSSIELTEVTGVTDITLDGNFVYCVTGTEVIHKVNFDMTVDSTITLGGYSLQRISVGNIFLFVTTSIRSLIAVKLETEEIEWEAPDIHSDNINEIFFSRQQVRMYGPLRVRYDINITPPTSIPPILSAGSVISNITTSASFLEPNVELGNTDSQLIENLQGTIDSLKGVSVTFNAIFVKAQTPTIAGTTVDSTLTLDPSFLEPNVELEYSETQLIENLQGTIDSLKSVSVKYDVTAKKAATPLIAGTTVDSTLTLDPSFLEPNIGLERSESQLIENLQGTIDSLKSVSVKYTVTAKKSAQPLIAGAVVSSNLTSNTFLQPNAKLEYAESQLTENLQGTIDELKISSINFTNKVLKAEEPILYEYTTESNITMETLP